MSTLTPIASSVVSSSVSNPISIPRVESTYSFVNPCTAYPVGATVLSKYRLQQLYRIRPVVRLAVLVLLLRRVRDQASVPLVVRGGDEVRLRVRVRLLEEGKRRAEHTSGRMTISSLVRPRRSGRSGIAPGVLTSNSASLFPGQFILNMTVSSKCRKSCPWTRMIDTHSALQTPQ